MKKKKLLAAAIVLCMVIQLLCACGKQKISMSDKVYVGVTCYDQNDTFLSELLVCFKEELNHLNKNGVETTVTVKNAAAHSVFYAPLYVAIEKGYFKDENIDLTLVTGFGDDA